MHHTLLPVALALLAAATFDELKQGAVTLERPQQTIAALVGACDKGDAIDMQECNKNLQPLKDAVKGKRVVMNFGANHEKFLQFEGERGGKMRFVWAPLIDLGNGLALTVGKPQKLSAQGNVVVGKRPIDGTSPSDILSGDLQRAAAIGQVGIEVIGKFGQTWALGGGSVKGVAFEVEALRFYHSRTGKPLWESTAALK
jgi:hypothetical protein